MDKKIVIVLLCNFSLQYASDLVNPGVIGYISSLYKEYEDAYAKARRKMNEEYARSYGGSMMVGIKPNFPSVDLYLNNVLATCNRFRLEAILQSARNNRNKDLEETVLGICASIDERGRELFWSKISDSYSNIGTVLEDIKKNNPDILPFLYNTKNANGDTVLMALCKADKSALFKNILWNWDDEELERNPKRKDHLRALETLNLTNKEGNTVLMIATMLEKINIIDTLINPFLKVDFGMKDPMGNTAFQLACQQGNLNSLYMLVQAQDYVLKDLKDSPLLFEAFLIACSKGINNRERANFVFDTLFKMPVVKKNLEGRRGYELFLNICKTGSEHMFDKVVDADFVRKHHRSEGYKAVLAAIHGLNGGLVKKLLNIDPIKAALDEFNGRGWCESFDLACNESNFVIAKLLLPHVSHSCVIKNIGHLRRYFDSVAAKDILNVYDLQEPKGYYGLGDLTSFWSAYKEFQKGNKGLLKDLLFKIPTLIHKKNPMYKDNMEDLMCFIYQDNQAALRLFMDCLVSNETEKDLANQYIKSCNHKAQNLFSVSTEKLAQEKKQYELEELKEYLKNQKKLSGKVMVSASPKTQPVSGKAIAKVNLEEVD